MSLASLRDKIARKTAQIGVIGLGYVGLPVACLFAEAGFDVTGVDIDPERIAKINAGISPIEGDEPGLAGLLGNVIRTGRLRATTDYHELTTADMVTINVETPVDEADHKPRYQALLAACHSLGPVLKPGALVIVESTIAPGTTEKTVSPALEAASGMKLNQGFYLGHCPERVMPGKLLYNLQHLSRVCGGSTPKTAQTMIDLYRHIVDADLDPCDPLTAELVKTTENAYRDVQIAFANEMALLCESLGADVWQVRELVNKSPNRNMHLPGAGVGGHCIPKDGWLLIANAPETFQPRLVTQARAINDAMPDHMFELTASALAEAGVDLADATVAVLGYAYLENADDTRNTPSAPLITRLIEAGATVRIHDPFVREYRGDWQEIVRDADAVVFPVAHQQYREIDLDELITLLAHPVLIDGRHIFEPEVMRAAGFIHRCVGVATT